MGALALHHEAQARRRQPRLFAVAGGTATDVPADRPAGATVAEPPAARAFDRPPGAPEAPLMPTVLGGPSVRVAAPRTLDAVVGDLFATAAAGRPATCLFCGGTLRPRPIASGAAGAGRCGGCGTSYE